MTKVLIAAEPGETLDILAAEIAGQGHDVTVAGTGLDACEIALRLKPDAVVLDAQLPVFDGLAVSRMLRDDPDVPQDLPIFIIAGKELDPKAVETAGVTELIPQRHQETDLRELFARHLGKALWL